MTGSGPDGAAHSLDVPIRPIRPPGGRDLRAWLVALAALAVVGTAAGFAVLSRPAGPETALVPGPAASPTRPAPTTPTGSAGPAGSASPRVEVMPEIANVPLPGAPSLVFFRRVGDDGHLFFWQPGERGLRPLWIIEDGFAEIAAAPLIGFLAPDKRSMFVRGFDSATSGQPDRGRLTSLDGASWTTSRLSGTFGWTWSADSKSIVVSAGPATWLLVEFGGGTAAEREIVVDPRLEPLRPRQPGLDAPRLTPAGFSADGRWVYGLQSRGDGTFFPAVRVAVADGSIETIAMFPTDGPEAIVPSDDLLAMLDPATSRSIDPRSLGFLPERPGHFDIHEADGGLAMSLDVDIVLSASWIGDGRLVISEASRYPNPTGTQVLIVDPDGTRRPPILTTGPVTGTSVASVFDGYALVGVVVERPDQVVLVCVVRLSDGAMSAIPLSGADLAGLQLGGWLP
jgi:hypothetical protein